MASIIRAIFGPSNTPADAQPDEENPPPPPPLYWDVAIPYEAARDRSIADGFFYSARELYWTIPASNGTSLVVFPTTLLLDKGPPETPLFHNNDRDDACARVDGAARIYERLAEDAQPHSRIVKYLGRTRTGYRLERPEPGPAIWRGPSGAESAIARALFQRWALQMLSALAFMHSRGVLLNNIEETYWLRSDYSIAIGSMIDASCEEIEVDKFSGYASIEMQSQWSDDRFHYGHVKQDLFLWAIEWFDLMCRQSPLSMHLGYSTPRSWTDEEVETIESTKLAVEEGTFDNWPELDRSMLGPVIVKAWNGEYETALDALQDARLAIEGSGAKLSEDFPDELEGHDWQNELTIRKDGGGNRYCTLREFETD